MDRFVVRGRRPLYGRVEVAGAKNAAFKMIAASLLTDEEVVLCNMPRIDDVRVMIRLVQKLGVEADWLDNQTLRLQAANLHSTDLDPELCKLSRCAIVTMGPLLARQGQVSLGCPGGDRIGKRPLDRHVAALEALGARFLQANSHYHAVAPGLRGTTIGFAKNTVMGTENVLLAGVLAEGRTRLENAAQEPEVDDLIALLNKMGARIERVEPRVIEIEGVAALRGAEHTLIPDRNEAVTYAVAAAVAGGRVEVAGLRPSDLTAFLDCLARLGVPHHLQGTSLFVESNGQQAWRPTSVETAIHPGFMTDWQAPLALLLTQADGRSLLHETIYEDRFGYMDELGRMGARIAISTPEAVDLPFDTELYNFDWQGPGQPQSVAVIEGPSELRGGELFIPDLRAGATLVLAALGAEGESQIVGVEHIDRGYESFDAKLAALGSDIQRVPGRVSARL